MDKQDRQTQIIIEEPLGDDDIRRYLPDAKIMRYSKLQNFAHIDELLPGKINYCILLYEDSPNKGHWVVVCKYGNFCEFFDSYGGAPDTQLNWNPKIINEKLDQEPYLTNLFNKCPYEVVYNPIKYQGDSDDINTCGRHCVFRIINLIEMSRNLSKYYQLMKEIKELTDYSYDDIVSNFINIL